MALQTATKTKQAAPNPKVTKTVAKQPLPAAAKKAAPKPAAKAAPKKPAETVTLKTVFEQLGEAHAMPRKQAHAMAGGLVELMTGILKNGDRVRLGGIGIIEVRDRPARIGRNPATGAAVRIAASRKVAFRIAKELKEAVLGSAAN